MKAKAYAAQFIAAIPDHGEFPKQAILSYIGIFGNSFIKDFNTVRTTRNIDIGSNVLSVVRLINEFNTKWQKIAYIVNAHYVAKYDAQFMAYRGFLEMLKAANPYYIDIIKQHNIK
jgi:hypothetical protein